MPGELLVPEHQIRERLGLAPKTIVERVKAVNIRKLRHVHPETGVHALYVNVSDVVELLQREYEVTESREVGQLLNLFRQVGEKV